MRTICGQSNSLSSSAHLVSPQITSHRPQARTPVGLRCLTAKIWMNGARSGESNWHIEDGVVIADKMPGKEAGYLVSKKSYKNFIVRVEFWPSDDANSGIYFRCLDPKKITDRTCYEANIFDQRPDPSYGTGAITRYVEINPMPKVGGKWNTYEVTANGRDITVVLNGQVTAKLRNGMFDEGPIVLQHGAGAIKFRKVEVKPL